VKRKRYFSFTANGLMKVLNLSVLFASWSMLHKRVWFTTCSCALATSMLNLLMQHQARSHTWIGVRAAFISDEQNNKYMCYTQKVEREFIAFILCRAWDQGLVYGLNRRTRRVNFINYFPVNHLPLWVHVHPKQQTNRFFMHVWLPHCVCL